MLCEPKKKPYKLKSHLTQSYKVNQIHINIEGYLHHLFWGSQMLVCAFSSAVHMVVLIVIQLVLNSHIHQFFPAQQTS